MAKRKTKTRTMRRRVSGISGGAVPQLVGIAGGALLAKVAAGKFLSTMDPKISALVQLAAGGFLLMQRQPIVKAIGTGIFASGAVTGGQAMKLIAGVNRSSFLQDNVPGEMAVIGDSTINYKDIANPMNNPEMAVISGLGYADDQAGFDEPDQFTYQGGADGGGLLLS